MLPLVITAVLLLAMLWALLLVTSGRRRKLPHISRDQLQQHHSRQHLKYHGDQSRTRTSVAPHGDLHRLPRGPIIAMLASLALALILLAWAWYSINHPADYQPYSRPRPEVVAMFRTAGELVGSFLVDNYTNRTATVLLPPREKMQDFDSAALKGLLKTAGSKLAVEIYHMPDSNPEDVPWYIPGLDAFSDALNDNRDSAVIVALTGLPEDAGQLKFWMRDEKPDLVLMNSPVYRLKKLLANGDIAAVVVRRPAAGIDPRPASSRENWLLITPDNIDAASAIFPGLFAQ